MTCEQGRQGLALTLVVVVLAILAAPPTWAHESALFSGRVVGADGLTPRAGAVVALVAPGHEAGLRSQQTRADGSFRIDGAPAGTYHLLVQADEGAYLFAEPLSLKQGFNTPLSLKLQAQPNFQTTAGTTTAQSSLPVWVKWVIVGVIVAAAVFVVSEVSKDEDEAAASPF